MELKEITELTIDREHWVHGGSRNDKVLGGSKLLNENNKMCCLGFMCQAVGVSDLLDENKQTITTPYAFSMHTDKTVPGLTRRDEGGIRPLSFTSYAMDINDDCTIAKEDRETQLTKLFKEQGIALTFKGKYPEGVK